MNRAAAHTTPKQGARWLLVALLALFSPFAVSRAAVIDNFRGYADVTAVQSRTGGGELNTLRQQYSLNWASQVLPYVRLRLGATYVKFDSRTPPARGVWTQDVQPSGDIMWAHPDFDFNLSARRRTRTATNAFVNVTNRFYTSLFRTKATSRPVLSLRYTSNHTFDNVFPLRDVRDDAFIGGLDYYPWGHTITYRFSYQNTRNVVSNLETDSIRHLFRWLGLANPIRRRLYLGWNYTYQNTQQTSTVESGDVALLPVTPTAGLYDRNLGPDFGTLDPVPTLIDGNTSTATVPAIDIGGDVIGQNIGVDFGVEAPASTVYIYTDGESGTGVTWTVYVSRDNLNWVLVSAAPSVTFNVALNRYEVSFPLIRERYLKVVNGGFNEILDVRVTEIEVYRALTETNEFEIDVDSHRFDGNATYRMLRNLNISADVAYQRLPAALGQGTQEKINYGLGARLVQSRLLQHTLRWAQDFQSFPGDRPDFAGHTLTYTLDVRPLPTLNGLFSLRTRHDFFDGVRFAEENAGVIQVTGTMFPRLNVSTDFTRNRIHDYAGRSRLDTSIFRVALDGRVARFLSMDASWRHQETIAVQENVTRVFDRYRIGFNLQLTLAIFARGGVSIQNALIRSTSQDYLLGWNPTRKLAFTASAILNKAGELPVTERYSVNLNYKLGSSGTIRFSYAHLDLAGGGGEVTELFQQGIRYVF